jgi:hypothetical protein
VTFVRRSNALLALYAMLMSYPGVSYALVFLLPTDLSSSFPFTEFAFLIVVGVLGLWPVGYLAISCEKGVEPLRWTIFSLSLYSGIIGAFLVFMATFADLLSTKTFSQLGYVSHIHGLCIVSELISVPSVLVSMATFPDREMGSRFAEFVTEYLRREVDGLRSAIKFVRSNALCTLRTITLDNIIPLVSVTIAALINFLIAINIVRSFSIIAELAFASLALGETGLAVYVISGLFYVWKMRNGLNGPIRLGGEFWTIYIGAMLFSWTLFYFQFLHSPLTSVSNIQDLALSAAIISVQIACFVGFVANALFGPVLCAGLTRILTYLIKFWKYSQLEETKVEVNRSSPPDVRTSQMFTHVFIEIVGAVLWVVVAFPGTFTAYALMGSLIYFGLVALVCLLVYVFLDFEIRGIEVGGTKINTKLLHKPWEALTAIAIISQLLRPQPSLLVSAIPISASTMLGFSLGFLCSYKTVGARFYSTQTN